MDRRLSAAAAVAASSAPSALAAAAADAGGFREIIIGDAAADGPADPESRVVLEGLGIPESFPLLLRPYAANPDAADALKMLPALSR